jgi:glycosyltransferase involved in cell wall biosynthesis
MNIALDISVLRIAQAGVLVYTRNLIDALVAEGQAHRFTLVDMLALNPDLPMRPLAAFDAPHVRLARVPALRRGYLSALPSLRDGLPHALAERVDRALDRPFAAASVAATGLALRGALAGCQVFHASDQFLHAPPGAGTVLTIHDMTTHLFPEWHVATNTAMHAAKERFAATRANQIVAVSEATKRDVVQHLDVPPERVSVVYEAADERFRPHTPDEIAPVVERYGLRPGGYILSVGTLEPRKNYEWLVEAYALSVECSATVASSAGVPKPINGLPELVIAGGRGWGFEPILAAPERFGVAGRVHFLGKVPDEDLPALMAGASLFVYPSLYEGFGLPPLEAMASGVPVVVAKSSSLPEVIGDAGVLCDPRDPADIAQRMTEVLGNPQLATRLREAGLRRAAQFSWGRTARETLAVYESLVGDGR